MATRGRIVKRFCKAVMPELKRDNATRLRSSSCDETRAQTATHGEDLPAALNHALADQYAVENKRQILHQKDALPQNGEFVSNCF